MIEADVDRFLTLDSDGGDEKIIFQSFPCFLAGGQIGKRLVHDNIVDGCRIELLASI